MAHVQLGRSYLILENAEEALPVLSKALELDPNFKETHFQLARVYTRLKDEEKRKHHLAIFERLAKEEQEKDRNQKDAGETMREETKPSRD